MQESEIQSLDVTSHQELETLDVTSHQEHPCGCNQSSQGGVNIQRVRLEWVMIHRQVTQTTRNKAWLVHASKVE